MLGGGKLLPANSVCHLLERRCLHVNLSQNLRLVELGVLPIELVELMDGITPGFEVLLLDAPLLFKYSVDGLGILVGYANYLGGLHDPELLVVHQIDDLAPLLIAHTLIRPSPLCPVGVVFFDVIIAVLSEGH